MKGFVWIFLSSVREQLTSGPAPQASWRAGYFPVVLNTLKQQGLFFRLWVWNLVSALFRKSISSASFPTGSVSSFSKNLNLSPGFLIHGMGRYWMSNGLQIDCYSRFCDTWCLVLHQIMDVWFCWFPSGEGILEPSAYFVVGPYGCRTERTP